MNYSSDMRRCLRDFDVVGARHLWRIVCPYMPQPATDEEAVIILHHARTQAPFLRLKERAWSHSWLLERGYPSGLPDELKPRAERIYPRVVEAVGVSVNTKSALLRPVARGIQAAMLDAVAECYADRRTDPVFVKARMAEARERQEKYFAELLKGR